MANVRSHAKLHALAANKKNLLWPSHIPTPKLKADKELADIFFKESLAFRDTESWNPYELTSLAKLALQKVALTKSEVALLAEGNMPDQVNSAGIKVPMRNKHVDIISTLTAAIYKQESRLRLNVTPEKAMKANNSATIQNQSRSATAKGDGLLA
jgi:hypothetical protein